MIIYLQKFKSAGSLACLGNGCLLTIFETFTFSSHNFLTLTVLTSHHEAACFVTNRFPDGGFHHGTRCQQYPRYNQCGRGGAPAPFQGKQVSKGKQVFEKQVFERWVVLSVDLGDSNEWIRNQFRWFFHHRAVLQQCKGFHWRRSMHLIYTTGPVFFKEASQACVSTFMLTLFSLNH